MYRKKIHDSSRMSGSRVYVSVSASSRITPCFYIWISSRRTLDNLHACATRCNSFTRATHKMNEVSHGLNERNLKRAHVAITE